ncbi:hypothetical protein KJ662_05595 [Patescibacteria group bacterium]|nr:hypothetical protein [Patescibacteria group bacterium]MBU1685694.1 hypothetical protein [Patescibacteria group bacterium]
MTNTLGIDFDGDLAEMVADMPASVTIGGTAYACAASPVAVGAQIDMGGVFSRVDFRLIVRTSLFSTRPVTGDKATYGGTEYRVLTVDTGADDAALVLTIGQVTG